LGGRHTANRIPPPAPPLYRVRSALSRLGLAYRTPPVRLIPQHSG
jgi:hypothetical protein